jgi:hypothetical protein
MSEQSKEWPNEHPVMTGCLGVTLIISGVIAIFSIIALFYGGVFGGIAFAIYAVFKILAKLFGF